MVGFGSIPVLYLSERILLLSPIIPAKWSSCLPGWWCGTLNVEDVRRPIARQLDVNRNIEISVCQPQIQAVTSLLEQQVRIWNVIETEAARCVSITQSRLNDLLRGKIDKFSLNLLINLAIQAGLMVRIDIT